MMMSLSRFGPPRVWSKATRQRLAACLELAHRWDHDRDQDLLPVNPELVNYVFMCWVFVATVSAGD